MYSQNSETIRVRSHSIRVLDPHIANRIAAGEVIDRPYSIIRELLDNSIDAGATKIEVEIEGGGIAMVAVKDNGHGITATDIELVGFRHSTSKIITDQDLQKIRTLGFRGEALASMAACAQLEITSRTTIEKSATRLLVSGNRRVKKSVAATSGTRVQITQLFSDLPARRRFLRRPGTETALCRRMIIEKSLAYPEIEFHFSVNGRHDMVLLRSSAVQRISDSLSKEINGTDLVEEIGELPKLKATIIGARSEFSLRNRRKVYVYVNQRKVKNYSLLQAIEYGYSAILPGGRHPIAYLFLEIDPELVDFNIHPAKEEVRFIDLSSVHQMVVRTTAKLVTHFGNRSPLTNQKQTLGNEFRFSNPVIQTESLITKHETWPSINNELTGNERIVQHDTEIRDTVKIGSISEWKERQRLPGPNEKLRYIGQALGLFLVVEINETIFFIDQHAAHERVIYEELRTRKYPPQKLLLPLDFELEYEQIEFARRNKENLEISGIVLEITNNKISIIALPPRLKKISREWLGNYIAGLRGMVNNLEQTILSDIACKLAVKDGELLDQDSAMHIIKTSFAIDLQHCPHGRPLWHSVSRQFLMNRVGR